ncbi:MAG: ribose-5-phosphate isomerase RpiA [Thermodesulfobacteriota bacterium]|nr:ribose-5-phosphate isomerase RpiA [Thermodesulfobacteriota bacterium]
MMKRDCTQSQEDQSLLKRKAAKFAVDFVESGMVLGLGSGSTARFAIELIGDRLKTGDLKDIIAIPSSVQTEKLATVFRIPLISFDLFSEIDLTIDGADEVDPQLDLIKGRGGALLREKVIAQVSQRNTIIVDETKLSPQLGILQPVPVEVIPFAQHLEMDYLTSLDAEVTLREKNDGEPFFTDEGNYILDSDFGPIEDPGKLASLLERRAGIVEHGLFLNLATDVIVAGKDGIRHLKREVSI